MSESPEPGVRVELLDAGRGLRVEIEDGSPARDPETEAAVERVWARLTAANPRLFNGTMLAFAGFDGATGRVRVRLDEFRRLAARPEADTGVVQFGVTGVLVAPDGAGRAHVLLGRRGVQTRVYGGMWELAPSGGVDPPRDGRRALGTADLRAQLRVEIDEELGLPVEGGVSEPVAICHDGIGHSCEVVMPVRLGGTVESLAAAGDGNWEYEATRWVPVDGAASFLAEEHERTIPPTRALLGVIQSLL